jgi:hypothetical protein
VFGGGGFNRHAAIPFGDGRTAFVIAGSEGYVVDVLDRSLVYRTEVDYWVTALTVPNADFVIAAEYTTIEAISRVDDCGKAIESR